MYSQLFNNKKNEKIMNLKSMAITVGLTVVGVLIALAAYKKWEEMKAKRAAETKTETK